MSYTLDKDFPRRLQKPGSIDPKQRKYGPFGSIRAKVREMIAAAAAAAAK